MAGHAPDPSSAGGGRFTTTHWSLVLAAAGTEDSHGREALARLVREVVPERPPHRVAQQHVAKQHFWIIDVDDRCLERPRADIRRPGNSGKRVARTQNA